MLRFRAFGLTASFMVVASCCVILINIILFQSDAETKIKNFDESLRFATTAKASELGFHLVVLSFLFIALGVTSSDFLCVNLTHISHLLHCSEKIAGMTLLALGNSSPDIFSTYIAMNSGLTSLSLGELIGSACFCVAVVIGLMGTISPFTIHNRKEFVMDLVFFTIFVGTSFYFIVDGKLTLYECIAMICLYLGYLSFLIWNAPRAFTVDDEDEDIITNNYNTDHNMNYNTISNTNNNSNKDAPIIVNIIGTQLENDGHSGKTKIEPGTFDDHTSLLPMSSSNSSSNPPPLKTHSGGYHSVDNLFKLLPRPNVTKVSSSHSIHKLAGSINSDNEIQHRYQHLPLGLKYAFFDMLPKEALHHMSTHEEAPHSPLLNTDESINSFNTIDGRSSISHETYNDLELAEEDNITLLTMLFPFIDVFRSRNPDNSILQTLIFYYLLCANVVPVFLLKLTVPSFDGNWMHLSSKYCILQRNLFMIQIFWTCWLISYSVWGIQLASLKLVLALNTAISFSLALFIYLWLFETDQESKHSLLDSGSNGNVNSLQGTTLQNSAIYRAMVSIVGFVNSITWIAILSALVICILQRIGSLFSISDPLLGLTLFAFGNSIGDLSANVAFAKAQHPLTGLGACFGSPLLYILLGIGLNGAIVILKNRFFHGSGQELYITFTISHSLISTSIGLACVLAFYFVAVPLNGWVFNKTMGVVSLTSWAALTCYNVVYEIFYESL